MNVWGKKAVKSTGARGGVCENTVFIRTYRVHRWLDAICISLRLNHTSLSLLPSLFSQGSCIILPKKVGTDIPDLKVPNQVIEKSWKNSPVLRDQFLDEDMGRFWHPLSSAGERGMTSGER